MKITKTRAISAALGLTIAASLALPATAMARIDDSYLAARRHVVGVGASVTAPSSTSAVTAQADAQLASDLAYMREEEKLAHDVYTVLAAKWGVNVFSNIAVSEQRHTDSLALLLDRYGVTDPADTRGAGVYSDPALQVLYDDLVARGSTSVEEAYDVGKLIEQTDIADLDTRIARTTQADVLTVYQNLRAGSVSHLNAFEARLSGTVAGPALGRGARGGAR